MKKSFIWMIAALMMVAMCFTGCKKKKAAPVEPAETAVVELVPERVVSMDRENMYVMYGGNYRWYETCIKLEKYLDDEDCDGAIESISNVFQAIMVISDSCVDTEVVLFAHTKDTATIVTKHAFWIEDEPLNDEAIKLTYKDAFKVAMEANIVKPHSKNCILRKPVGPVDCNPQYVFGNLKEQIWVDAITGEVASSNPSFPDELAKPLGEWP